MMGKIAVSPFQAITVAQMLPSSSPYLWMRRTGTVSCAQAMNALILSTLSTLADRPNEPSVSSDPGFSIGPVDAQRLREAYRLMLLARRYDEDAVRLQRQGELVAFPPMSGQEAAQVASVMALRPTDMIFPTYRELGAAVARGVAMTDYMLTFRGAWYGGLYDFRGHCFAPMANSVGSHLLPAVGWAMGARMDGRDDVAIAYFGEGASSEGDASEAFNFAGVFRAPVIFLCQNNGWAISVPVERQTAGEIWRRAEGFGFTGVRVDGTDVEAVWAATSAAAGRARRGGGPTLIEALTHRFGAHSTADDDTRYRERAEVEAARRQDPLERLRARLVLQGVDEAWFEGVDEEAQTAVAALRASLASREDPPPLEMFDFVYASPPPTLAGQRRELEELLTPDA
jgi:pyruvate dehydrogenase E1 component alpha subunit